MSFNLKSIKTLEVFEVEIKDDEGNPTGVFFTLASPNHPIRKQMQLSINRKLIAHANKTGKVELPDPEDAEADKIKNLAQSTLGWRGYVNDEGEDVPFSLQAATDLYKAPEMSWLVDQIDNALVDKALFTKRSAKA
jgi:hypothetical protein